VLIPEDAPLVDELVIACARCERTAARLQLYDGYLAVREFAATEMRVDHERAEPLREAIAARDAAAVHEVWCDFAPCFCRGCRLSYCSKCWRGQLVFDDGLYDCTRGTCPNGHEQIIDD
jgi:hypothetical protein